MSMELENQGEKVWSDREVIDMWMNLRNAATEEWDPYWADEANREAVYASVPAPMIKVWRNSFAAVAANHTRQSMNGWRRADGWQEVLEGMAAEMVGETALKGWDVVEPEGTPRRLDRWAKTPYTELLHWSLREGWICDMQLCLMMTAIVDMRTSLWLDKPASYRYQMGEASGCWAMLVPWWKLAQGDLPSGYGWSRDIATLYVVLPAT